MSQSPSDVVVLPVHCVDGHRFDLLLVPAADSRLTALFCPALGVSARHYLPLAQQLATHGITVALHEWRGHGSSSLRAGRRTDWGFEQQLLSDLPASLGALADAGHPADTLAGRSLGGQLAVAWSACNRRSATCG